MAGPVIREIERDTVGEDRTHLPALYLRFHRYFVGRFRDGGVLGVAGHHRGVGGWVSVGWRRVGWWRDGEGMDSTGQP